jgi:hypothetical protein
VISPHPSLLYSRKVESNLALLHSMSSQLLLLLAFINFHSVTILTVSSSATDRQPMSVRQKGGAISSARPPAAYERSEGKIKASPPPNPYSAPRSPWRLPPPARAVDPVSGDAAPLPLHAGRLVSCSPASSSSYDYPRRTCQPERSLSGASAPPLPLDATVALCGGAPVGGVTGETAVSFELLV